MGSIISDLKNFWSIRQLMRGDSVFNLTQHLLKDYQWLSGKPSWVSLVTPLDFEKAVRENPIVKGTINLLAASSSNGRKVAVDIKTGEVIDWLENEATRHAYKLIVQRPNPLQSSREFAFQGVFYLKTFGNRYVYANIPIGFKKLDLMKIQALYNLPSQFIKVNTTGKLYDQTELSQIISEYALTNYDPIKKFNPQEIIHFNEVNISSKMATIMGISKLEVLKMPITNTQKAFEAMNTILSSRGMQGIISPRKKDEMGAVSLIPKEKEELQKDFRDYGLLNNQNPFLISPIALEYIKTIMNSEELGIYKEFSNNAILIGNEFGVPPELIKTYIQGATYENQIQSVRRLYQDTTIPMVADEDDYWSFRLNTFEYGFKVESRWEHIPALSINKKENAMTLNLKGRAAKDAYDNNIITWNQYLIIIDLPPVDGGDVYKYQRKTETNETE